MSLERMTAPLMAACVDHNGSVGKGIQGEWLACRFAITGSEDCTARVWDLQAPPQQDDQNHAGKVHNMSVAPDGATAVSVAADGCAMVWDVRSGSCCHALKGHAAALHWACLASDGRTLLTAAGDRMVKIWDCVTGSCSATLPSICQTLHCLFGSHKRRVCLFVLVCLLLQHVVHQMRSCSLLPQLMQGQPILAYICHWPVPCIAHAQVTCLLNWASCLKLKVWCVTYSIVTTLVCHCRPCWVSCEVLCSQRRLPPSYCCPV